MPTIRRRTVVAAFSSGLLAAAVPAMAQGDYPHAKPITVVVSYPPGGDTDAVLADFAGMDAEEIAAARAAGIV